MIIARLLSNLDRLKELRKKNTILRKALEEIAQDEDCEMCDVLYEVKTIAKKALEETK